MQSAPSETPNPNIQELMAEIRHANRQLRYNEFRQIFALDSEPLNNDMAAQILAALRAERINSIRITCFSRGAACHSVVFARSQRGIERAQLEIRRLVRLHEQIEPVIY